MTKRQLEAQAVLIETIMRVRDLQAAITLTDSLTERRSLEMAIGELASGHKNARLLTLLQEDVALRRDFWMAKGTRVHGTHCELPTRPFPLPPLPSSSSFHDIS